MSNYNKSTNFAVKDTLQTGDPEKLVSGAEIDNELNSISSAITTKTDKQNGAATDNLAAFDANGNLKDSGESSSSIETKIADLVPAGTVSMFASVIEPDGWLICDGRLLDRSQYSDLFNAIGTQFGTTSSTNFNLPDLRGEFVRGWDNGRGVDNNRPFGGSQLDQMQDHKHQAHTPAEKTFTYDFGTITSTGGITSQNGNPFRVSLGDFNIDNVNPLSGPLSESGSQYRAGSETRSRNVALNFIIKT